ncbi:MAG: cysteine--tRNA ligase [Patescibacteria group bacterium]|nr:cysteine--tRNA ligase [Patescibacteria group bacterium]
MEQVGLRFYNTLTKTKEKFEPINKGSWFTSPLVKMYSCGPTVYRSAHIGNMRAYLFTDILKRTLIFAGYKVNHVMNITDVGHLVSDSDEGEDKVEKAARTEKKTAEEITKYYADEFKKDLGRLNILFPTKWGWASEYIPQQIKLIQELEKKEFTYKTDDGIYFDTEKFSDYGKLGLLSSGQSRVAHDDQKKRFEDFALWKFSKENENRQMEWESPWGVGYPGWHIECSAISTTELGQPFDIHTGGVDHIAIHHNNEIAQSEAAYGKNMANFWMHNDFLLAGNEKMAKSTGNFFTVEDLVKDGVDPLAFRYLVISGHYRSKLNFSKSALEGADNSLNKIRELFTKKKVGGMVLQTWRKKFLISLADDLNVPEALTHVWALIKDESVPLADKQATLLDFDNVLGLGLKDYEPRIVPENIVKLMNQREIARNEKDFEKADELREKIEKAGFVVVDGESGPEAKPKKENKKE